MTSSTRMDLVEHVRRAVVDGAYRRRAENGRLSELSRFQAESVEERERAKDAIIATLQYVRGHVSEEMLAAMRLANMNIAGGYGGPSGWEAAIDALLKEIGGETDGPR